MYRCMALLLKIENEDDHAAALKEIGVLMEAEEGAADDDRLEFLFMLVEAYDEIHYPMPMSAD